MRSRASISATARGSNGSTGSADTSERALKQSYGLMVNYLYDLDYIERNHEAYAQQRAIVAVERGDAAGDGAGARNRPGFGVAVPSPRG